MDSTRNIENPNPREKANVFSVLFWTWTLSFFKIGGKEKLGTEDLYSPIKSDLSSILGNRLEDKWNKELQTAKHQNRRPSLLRTLFLTFWQEYLFQGIIHVFSEMFMRLLTPLLLGGLLSFFKLNSDTTKGWALIYAGGICTIIAVNAVAINQAIFKAFHIGGKMRIAVCSVIYRKALRLSKTALGETAPGKIVNLVASDVNRFEVIPLLIHHMWTAPASALIIASILYYHAGYSGLIGIAVVFTVLPFQVYFGKLSSKFRLQTSLKMDERVRLMDEIISGMQVIKMYAWEKPFCILVQLSRKLELKVVRKSSYLRGLYMTFNLFTTRMALFATLVTLLLTDHPISADKVFVFQAYFSVLAQTMAGMFVRGFAELAEGIVAVRRLQKFLMFEEFQQESASAVLAVSNISGSRHQNSKLDSSRASKLDLPFIDDDFNGLKKKELSASTIQINNPKQTANDGKEYHIDNKNENTVDDKWSIKFDHVTAKWGIADEAVTLDNINLDVEKGQLYVVIGTVGSGKTSFLNAVLGELSLVYGNVKLNGLISYAGQDSWVFGASVRQNILFGEDFDRNRYQEVVKVCALQTDFKQFPYGDQTIVGERGSSLSGGQKARINLARAVYRQADIYLLDDPLSAVDAHVGKHLFEECLQNYLSKKTRILATHQLQYIMNADKIVLVQQGKIALFHNYKDLFRDYPHYSHLIAKNNAGETSDGSTTENSIEIKRQLSHTSNKSQLVSTDCESENNEELHENKQINEILEGTSKGSVKGSISLKYLEASGSVIFSCSVTLLFLLTQAIVSLNDAFVPVFINAQESKFWHDSNPNYTENRPENILPKYEIYSDQFYVYLYSGLIFLIFIIGVTRSFMFYSLCLRSSQRLHDKAFFALIRAPMRFFDTNPSGRILNRFSKDMGSIDELLPKAILDASQIILLMTGSIVITCFVNKLFIIPVLVIGAIFYWIKNKYLKASKNVKRLEGMTRSPVFTHLNTTLNGLSTIRAYKAETILKKEFDKYQDFHTSSWYMFIATSSAFGFSIDAFSFIFTTLVTFSFLILHENYNGGSVGLAITQVMTLTGMYLQWGMRQAAEVSNQMMSVERVLEYSNLPCENNLRDKEESKKKKRKQFAEEVYVAVPSWPSKGLIEFKHVFMRYADDDIPVLKDLNLVIKSMEKVGVVGRTGAGKSSLIAALFRLANVEGMILIDNIDTGTVALEDLRRGISIIPQDPVLFSGTLRRNLDPFSEFSDVDLWKVLDEVELKDAVAATGNGLDSRVFDRGTNYSVGQRQLVCLARAILRNNRILMLDEATANVDPQTDALIQRTIRTKFASCTVLTIAHRLNTIIDCDKVLVMDQGRLVEFDHPYILLQNPQGHFTSLVKETGSTMYEKLLNVARNCYQKNNGIM